jgi:uncharacterized protein (DUF58 family)
MAPRSKEDNPNLILLDPEIVHSVSSLQVHARTIVEGALSGLHKSRLKGSSVEFSEYKEYSPGDEIRHIDWRTYGRTDRFFVKQFEEDTNLRAYLVLDLSGSMSFASEEMPSKANYGILLSAALAYLFIKQSDAVGLMTFDSKPRTYLPSHARPGHLDNLLRVLSQPHAPNPDLTNISLTLKELTERLTKRSMIIIISDFIDLEPSALEALKIVRSAGHDLTLFHMVDNAELTFPFEGLTRFEGLEGEGELIVDPDDIRTQYLLEMRRHHAAIKQTCIHHNITYQRVLTETPLKKTIHNFILSRRAV